MRRKRKLSKIEKVLLIAVALVAAIVIAALIYGLTRPEPEPEEYSFRFKGITDNLPLPVKEKPQNLIMHGGYICETT